MYLKGDKNKVTDSLTCYFSSDMPGESHTLVTYVNADSRLDPDTDDLPIARRAELITMHVGIVPPETELIKSSDQVEERELLYKELLTNAEARDKPDPSLNFKDRALQAALKHFNDAYKSDKFFAEILKNNSHYEQFYIQKDLIWTTNRIKGGVVCIPDGLLKGKSL